MHDSPTHILYLWHMSDLYNMLDSVSATIQSSVAASNDRAPLTTVSFIVCLPLMLFSSFSSYFHAMRSCCDSKPRPGGRKRMGTNIGNRDVFVRMSGTLTDIYNQNKGTLTVMYNQNKARGIDVAEHELGNAQSRYHQAITEYINLSREMDGFPEGHPTRVMN
ncbi:MAG: hypothetical protein ACREOZ_04785 [Gloeomargaritales cyanobacterium]